MDVSALALDLPGSISIDVASAAEGVLADLLSAEERVRLATLEKEDRRTRFTLGRTALRRMLAAHLGVEPASVPLRVSEGGRLEVADGIHVSLSHAGRGADAAAAAAVAGAPVGLDIERVSARHPELWRRILRKDEYGHLEALGGPTDDAQTLLWVLKEAVLKGQGTGLRAGMHSVRLDLEARVAHSDVSGRWFLRFDRVGNLWVAVAFQ